MNDRETAMCCCTTLGGLLTAGYITYVTVTHGDGAVLAAFCTGIGSVIGYIVKLGTAKTAPAATKGRDNEE